MAKLKIFLIALVAMVVALVGQSSLAYYQTIGKSTNVITSGNIRFVIHETTEDGNEFPEEGVYIMPGDIVSKKVTFENICTHPFYLRVKPVYGVDSVDLSAEDCFKLNINEENWTYYDGWYYYNSEVNPNETTAHIFSHVEILGSKINNTYLGKTLMLTVKAQAVQSENNPLTDGKTYTALGWPME